MSAYEAPALPGFGRDYSQANWNRQVAALLRQLDLQHRYNVARSPQHPPVAFENWLAPVRSATS
jgi:hypothetical protein